MEISKIFAFEASHILPRHPGKCSRLHGHSWKLRVTVFGPVNKDSCFVMDYAELKAMVQPIVDRFDHQHLNAFVRYPSSENLAIHIAHELQTKLPEGVSRYIVEVSETESTWSRWDSASDYDVSIFTKDMLDSAMGAVDAEWRSPCQNDKMVSWPDSTLEDAARTIFAEFETYVMELAQRKLYRESLGKPGAVLDEIQKASQDEMITTEFDHENAAEEYQDLDSSTGE